MNRRELVEHHYAEVLMAMCEDHKLADITVSDLISAAGTARQTFYNHFSDINDLICFAASLPVTTSTDVFTDPDATRRTYAAALFYRAFYQQLAYQTGQNNFWDALDKWLLDTYYERFLTPDLDEDETSYRKACLNLYCIGSARMFRLWCAGGMKEPVEALSRAVYDMNPPFVTQTLNRLPAKMEHYPR